MFSVSGKDLPKPGSAQETTELPKPTSGPISKEIAECPHPGACSSGLSCTSYREMPDPHMPKKPSAFQRAFSIERTEGFEESIHLAYSFRRNMFMGYLIVSMVLAVSSACVSVLLDTSVLQYLGLIRGQLHSSFIVVVAHCFFVLVLSALGLYSVYRRGHKTVIAYMILSATLFMLVLLSILYGLAMRHEVQIHLYKTMLKGVHNYAEMSDLPVNGYWDNVQSQFQCCGLYGPSDWKYNKHLNASLPDSCCKDTFPGCGKGQLAHPDKELVFVKGCYDEFFDWLNVFTYEMIGLSSLLVVWQILGVFVSWNLARITKIMSRNERRELKLSCCCCC